MTHEKDSSYGSGSKWQNKNFNLDQYVFAVPIDFHILIW
jgi:hypothetical protein